MHCHKWDLLGCWEVKGIQIVQEEIKPYLFTDGMVLYIENHKDSTKTITANK